MRKQAIKYLIGIDEAGRGALAGPVAVGLVMWAIEDWPEIKKFLKAYPVGRDSKKLSPKQRDFWFAKIEELSVRHPMANKNVKHSVLHILGCQVSYFRREVKNQ